MVQKASGKTIQHPFSVEEYGNCCCSFRFLAASPMGHERLIEQSGRSDQDVLHGWKMSLCPLPPKRHSFWRREDWRTWAICLHSSLSPRPCSAVLPTAYIRKAPSMSKCACSSLCCWPVAIPPFRGDLKPQPHLQLATHVKCDAMSLGLTCLSWKVLTFWCMRRL